MAQPASEFSPNCLKYSSTWSEPSNALALLPCTPEPTPAPHPDGSSIEAAAARGTLPPGPELRYSPGSGGAGGVIGKVSVHVHSSSFHCSVYTELGSTGPGRWKERTLLTTMNPPRAGSCKRILSLWSPCFTFSTRSSTWGEPSAPGGIESVSSGRSSRCSWSTSTPVVSISEAKSCHASASSSSRCASASWMPHSTRRRRRASKISVEGEVSKT
mmetsp:Transcript_25267/g.84088  ORF Transcript_25267/g.84088 Transcript_25267/m.84088 type:complete len:215 (+) Transcript_25267:192-836(+)